MEVGVDVRIGRGVHTCGVGGPIVTDQGFVSEETCDAHREATATALGNLSGQMVDVAAGVKGLEARLFVGNGKEAFAIQLQQVVDYVKRCEVERAVQSDRRFKIDSQIVATVITAAIALAGLILGLFKM